MGRGSEHLGSHGVIYDIKIAHSRYGSRIHLLLERGGGAGTRRTRAAGSRPPVLPRTGLPALEKRSRSISKPTINHRSESADLHGIEL